MNSKPLPLQKNSVEVSVFECEISLKFRIIEETGLLKDINDKDQLIQFLLESFTAGNDDFLETQVEQVKAYEVDEIKASPQMRRQLMRLRNSPDNI
jgi:Npun R1517